jgi:hypothetical protein
MVMSFRPRYSLSPSPTYGPSCVWPIGALRLA